MGQMGNQLDRWHTSSVPVGAHLLRFCPGLRVALVAVAHVQAWFGILRQDLDQPAGCEC